MERGANIIVCADEVGLDAQRGFEIRQCLCVPSQIHEHAAGVVLRLRGRRIELHGFESRRQRLIVASLGRIDQAQIIGRSKMVACRQDLSICSCSFVELTLTV